jgi:hypothetical protein
LPATLRQGGERSRIEPSRPPSHQNHSGNVFPSAGVFWDILSRAECDQVLFEWIS